MTTSNRLAVELPKPPKVRSLLPWLAFIAPAIFALSTNNIWEDFFITYRCSLNLVQGHGLVYEVGRKIHVFTSPLGTLLPAGISWLLHTADPQVVIDGFRLFGCLALAGSWMLVASRIGGSVALATTAGLWLLDCKLAAFSTNGMETAFLVLFVVLGWRATVDSDMRLGGIALGGALWTRPDGFVFIGALVIAGWLVQRGWRMDWSGWIRLVGWGVVIYLPWFLWAWWYYGSPIPHTIIAKSSLVSDGGNLRWLASYPVRLLFGHTATDDSFLPPYFYFGGWPGYLSIWSKVMTLGAVVASVWRRCPQPARIAGVAFLLGGFYLEMTPLAPWYFPAWQVLAYIAIGGLMGALVEKSALRWRQCAPFFLGASALLLVFIQGGLFVMVSIQLREQQNLIENGLRVVIGNDLRKLASKPSDTVFLEPLGYIGYFSGLSMRDTPGLCSPEVVSLRRSGKIRMAELAMALSTDWVVLRRREWDAMTSEERPLFDRRYQFVRQYSAEAQVGSTEFLPGRNYLRYDSNFTLWHLRTTAP